MAVLIQVLHFILTQRENHAALMRGSNCSDLGKCPRTFDIFINA